MAKKRADILIIGGGLIGLCLAPILGKINLSVILVDQDNISSERHIHKDSRTIAISQGTMLLFKKFGIWQKISPYVQPINQIQVLNRSSKSKIFFNNTQLDSPMGYIVDHAKLKKKLLNIIKKNKNIKIIENNKIIKINCDENYISIKTNNKLNFQAKVLIAADGKNSFVRSYLKIPNYKIQYNQSALVLNFTHTKNHNNSAYEIFLPDGPLATLPMKFYNNKVFKSSLIWSEDKLMIKKLLNLQKENLKHVIQEKVYKYLGNIKDIESIKTFPLSAHICRKFYHNRTVLIGDAAHSIHPIAGQGWNLGIRDIKCIIECFESYSDLGIDLGSQEVLINYNDRRYADVFSMLFITHSLNKIFCYKSKIAEKIRSIGFNYINSNKKINAKLVNYASGTNL